MTRQLRILSLTLAGLACGSTAIAQTATANITGPPTSSLTITAAASSDRVRVTGPSSIVQMRLEVYAPTGEKLFDEELRGANVFDWHLQNGQAERLSAGDYACVVTAKAVSGKLTQKIGVVTVADMSASVRAGSVQQLT
ncbi:MAG TPA: hypothetical protein VE863_20185, partial [Pyrinomonadaceae bacterium]|nr:hypothetical protein [Pyrinomonadaceae bacterium]